MKADAAAPAEPVLTGCDHSWVGVEVALAMVALASAGLFVRSFRIASRIEPGFDTRNVVVAQFYLSNAGYTAQEQWAFCRSLRERMDGTGGRQRDWRD